MDRQLPQLYPPKPGENGDFIPPEEGWHDLIFEVCRDDAGFIESRHKQFQGKIDPEKRQVRLRFRVTDDEEASPWRQWVGYSLHEKATLRHMVDAIRRNKPLDPTKAFKWEHYEGKPFRGMVTVDEVPAQDDPERILLFPKILKFKAIGDPEDETPVATPEQLRRQSAEARAMADQAIATNNPYDDGAIDF